MFVGHVDHVDLAAKPGIVDQNVDMAEFLDRRGVERVDLVQAGHVADESRRALAAFGGDPVGRFAQPPLVKIAHQHGRAFFHRALGGGKADAGAGCGGDDHGLAGQQVAALRIGRDRSGHYTSPRGSRGMPRPRSAIRLRWIWLVPP